MEEIPGNILEDLVGSLCNTPVLLPMTLRQWL